MTTPPSSRPEILSHDGFTPSFSLEGIGQLVGRPFDDEMLQHPKVFPRVERGRTLILVGDFSGQHRGQHFDTYSFLICDLDCNSPWLSAQKSFRNHVLPQKRRMSFKGMNDGKKRAALVPFLRMASKINGCLVQFAVSKNGDSLFTSEGDLEQRDLLLSLWKPATQERLLRIIHLSAFLLSGLSAPDQDLLWIVDQDEIAANVAQLTQLTEVFGRVLSNYSTHGLRHIRCGTTLSDDGSLALEDLAAIPDLTAGALSEICTRFVDESAFPLPGIISPLNRRLSWKSRLISSWMAHEDMPLRRYTCILELRPKSTKTRVTMLKWQAFSSQIVIP